MCVFVFACMWSQTAAEVTFRRTTVNRLATMSNDSLHVESWCSAAVVQGLFKKTPTHTHTHTHTHPVTTYTTFFLLPICVGEGPHTGKWRRLLLRPFFTATRAHTAASLWAAMRARGGGPNNKGQGDEKKMHRTSLGGVAKKRKHPVLFLKGEG